MEIKSGAFRKKKVYFSQVSNLAIRDKGLSLKAKGLYALIQSYITIEGFVLYKSTLKKDCHEKDTAFENAWAELKHAGYLRQYKIKTEQGFFAYEYELLDEKEPEIAENIDIHHTPKTEGVDNLPSGQHRVSNKMDKSNTDLNNTEINKASERASACSDDPEFSDELIEFVDFTYPGIYQQYIGRKHPHLKAVQRLKVLIILNSYLEEYSESVEGLEAAAERFLSDKDHGDGNINLFANPSVISIRLVRGGSDEHIGDCDCLHY